MASEVLAQQKLTSGSFIESTVTEGHLEKGTMYRVKSTKQDGRYIILDELFCGTKKLKNKTLTYQNRFNLLNEDDVKSRFKSLLTERMFTTGQDFIDVRDGCLTKVYDDSRTHILAKFGKFMGVKIAGGHVWFAGKSWAKGLVDLSSETRPDETEAVPTEETTPVATHIFVICETKSEATAICNRYAGGNESYINNWNVYGSNTAYRIDIRSQRINYYCSLSSAEEDNAGFPIYTYKQWDKITNPQNKPTKQRKTVSMTGSSSIESQILAVVDEHLDSQEARD